MRGSLIKRGEHSWSIVLDTGRDLATGKRRQQWVSIRGTKRDAEKRLSELLHQLDTGSFVRPDKQTLGAFLRQWLGDYASTNVRPRTFEGYAAIVEGHLAPVLGGIVLAQLSPQHLQGYYSDKLSKGLSGRTVLHHHRVLREALGHAVRWGLLARNVADAVDPPRASRKEMQSLDSDGVHRLLEVARATPHYHLIHLAVYTGLRRSELLGLRWKDVDLDMAQLSVVQVAQRLRDGRTIFQEPKTPKSRRLVALSPAAVLALREHRKGVEAQATLLGMALGGDTLVFCRVDGAPLSPSTVSHGFLDLARKAGLTGIRFHDLRHTHASLMLKAGIHPKIVSDRLGHSTIAITLDTYSHVLPGLQAAAALRFDEGLAEPRPALEPALAAERR